jgi:hypothetical protein
MQKIVSSCLELDWQNSASLGEDSESSCLVSGRNFLGHLASSVCDRLIYVHGGFGFYYNCANKQSLCDALADSRGVKKPATVDGDNYAC